MFTPSQKPRWSYGQCQVCGLVFLSQVDRPSAEEERRRYLQHQNDSNDRGYQESVKDLIELVQTNGSVKEPLLDFGSGRDSAAAKVLIESGFTVDLYDPVFFPNSPLRGPYTQLLTSEVVEHFREPYEDWKALLAMTQPGAHLFIQTEFLTSATQFDSWYYRRDPTHFSFYSRKTLDWICQSFHLELLWTDQKKLAHLKVGQS